MKKSICALLLCMLLFPSFTSVKAMAEETGRTEILTLTAEMNSAVPEDNGQSAEELLTAYAQHELDALAGEVSAAGNLGSSLTGANAALYRELKTEIEKIAAGDRTSTRISLDSAVLFGKTTFTADELGVELVVDGAINQAAIEAAVGSLDTPYVVDILLQDCPYELYWFDKTRGHSFGLKGNYSVSGNTLTIPSDYSVSFVVAGDCAARHVMGGYETDPTVGQQVQSALTNIRFVVSNAVGLDDLGKLIRYKQEICDRVSYNYTAAGGGYTYNYGNPWQLIWVFDDDKSTTVVCEGYAKAFQYLCDLTEFSSVSCYTVFGDMVLDGEDGGHMWNIVRMPDGKNYLADITNCDGSNIGSPDLLFLKGFSTTAGSYALKDLQYSYNCYGAEVYFVYDKEIFPLFTESDLLLSAADYGSVETPEGEKVAIDREKFPDEQFCMYVAEAFDTDRDGLLSAEEMAAVTEIDVNRRSIADLTGIELFTALTSLRCGGNELTSLDLSGNTALNALDCSGNKLNTLILGNKPQLTSCCMTANLLEVVDISGCPVLLELAESGTFTEEPDTVRCTKLRNGELCELTYDKAALLRISADQQFRILQLPALLAEIEEEAFAGVAADKVILPDGCRQVAARAFADCPQLKIVSVPANAVIDENAFQGSNQVYVLRRAS